MPLVGALGGLGTVGASGALGAVDAPGALGVSMFACKRSPLALLKKPSSRNLRSAPITSGHRTISG